MLLQSTKYIKSQLSMGLLLSVVMFLSSCGKTDESVQNTDKPTININLLGIDDSFEGFGDNSNKAANEASAPSKQQTSLSQETMIPFDDKLAFYATLTPEKTLEKNTISSNGVKAQKRAENVRNPLGNNIKYKVLVYDIAGQLKGERDYNNTAASNALGIILDAGETYTFIVYSINSVSDLPVISGKATLATASLNGVTQDLMYFRKVLKLTYGQNNLDVILKHQFSQITTRIQLASTVPAAAVISAISGTAINPTSESASIKLSDGTITYGSAVSAGANVTFTGLNSRVLTSTPTQVISANTVNGSFRIGNITVNGTQKSNFVINNLRIAPGIKYNLNLTLQSPCTEDLPRTSFNLSGGNPQTFTAPGADYGFVFDLIRLDNSFNLRINNTLLSTTELQFEGGIAALPRNIQFEDGAIWGTGASQIYNMTGTQANPIIRVIINETGDVSILGSKTSGGPLFPLRLTNGNQFNRITWNKTGNNTIVATQSVQGATLMQGSGYGKKIVNCP